MLAFNQKRIIDKGWQNFVTPNDQRIAQISGMPFGDGYKKLLNNIGHTLDSEPPAKAMLVAQQMKQSSLEMLAAIQDAHFVKGLDISDSTVLSQLADRIGLGPYTFLKQFQQLDDKHMANHFDKAASLLSEVNGQGYPSAILEIGGEKELLNLSDFYHKPSHWKSALLDKIVSSMATA